MAASGAPARQPRRGPAPIASFDHDVSDESSPETKQAIRLPEIREDPSNSASAASPVGGDALAPPEQRARSHSTPAASGLQTPATPRIDISRASSSSHQDSRDSSPELALFAGTSGTGGEEARARLELGFREDGALDLRSSTEELAFLEPAPGEPRPAAAAASAERRHSRKDSQGSEAALLAVSGRTSRLSSVGSQCSAHSALSGFSHTSRVSRLSVVSGVSRSPSPHRMLLETSFCGPKPIETDPEICAAVVEERLLEMAKLNSAPAPTPVQTPAPVDARDRREVRTEATVERASSRPPSVTSRTAPASNVAITPSAPRLVSPTPAAPPTVTANVEPQPPTPDDDKRQKETRNRARAEERRARSRDRREPRESEIKRSVNRSKDIIRIRLKPDSEYEDDDEDESERTLTGGDVVRKPGTLSLGGATRPTELTANTVITSPTPSRHRVPRESRTPSPAGPVVSRKSSFCSLFKSRETIASPESPSDALRRKKSLTEGRSRSRSRDRSATPTSAAKIRGSVLSLFRTPRKSATSPSPSSRDGSPVVQTSRPILPPPVDKTRQKDRLKYYEDAKDGIIHIPLRTPPDELNGGGAKSSPSTSAVTVGPCGKIQVEKEVEIRVAEVTTHREPARPASAPQTRTTPGPISVTRSVTKPIQRTVLPDGSIIIPLHSPTEKNVEDFPTPAVENSHEKKCDIIVDAVVQALPKITPSSSEDFKPTVSQQRTEVLADSPPKSTATPVSIGASKEIEERPRKKERILFSTHVGSRDQVFSTQFSITKTPSVTSEISGSFPSFPDEESRAPTLRDTHITTTTTVEREKSSPIDIRADAEKNRSRRGDSSEAIGSSATSPQDAPRDSSESEPSSEAAPARCGNDVEQRGLVVQESFEEELPYVPTTLPLERSLALPMVPVRDRGDVRVAALERPRAAAPRVRAAPAPPAPRAPSAAAAPPSPPAADKIRIRLPRRPRTTSASGPSRSERARARSGSEGYETRPRTEWIDFEEVPERRKQPKRIQTLPAATAATTARDVVFNYVEPEECRCECHGHGATSRADDELPLLDDQLQQLRVSSSSLECGDDEARVQLSVQIARPFTADLDLTDTQLHRPQPQPH